MIKLSDDIIKFPVEFPIKVVGKKTDEFEIAVLTIIRKHIPDLRQTAITHKTSKNNKYIALTVTVYATSKSQLDNIYTDLSNEELVIMAL